jgi:flavin-dependent dehydrogenase
MGAAKLEADIVVLGAGISGLLLAAELSRSHKVVVVEKEKPQQQQEKYWVTPSDVPIDPLGGHIDQKYQFMDFIGFDGTYRRVHGELILWDGAGITAHLYNRAAEGGCRFLFEHHFFSFQRSHKRITVQCEETEIECSLIVDCMGWQSPFGLSFSLVTMKGYYFAVGAELEMHQPLDPVCLHNIRLGPQARYIEIFPRSNGRAYVSLIAPLSHLDSRKEVSREFHFILDHTPYRSKFSRSKASRPLFGIVPVGAIRRRSIDNVYFFGEAGFTHPAATGACLTPMLRSLRAVAGGLSDCVTEGRLDARDLATVGPGLTRLNQRFQLNLYSEVLSWTSAEFSSVLKKLEGVDDEIISRVLFGNIDMSSILTAKNIVNLARNRNWPLLRAAAQMFLK